MYRQSRTLHRRQMARRRRPQGRGCAQSGRPKSRSRICRMPAKPISTQALEAAKKGFAVWRATSAYDRCKIMHKAADLMRERHDAIAKIMVLEQGKIYPEARAEVIGSADIIDWYAEEGRRSYGRIVPGRGKGVRQLVVQEPIGVVAAFTPWNFPVLDPGAQDRRRARGRLLAHPQSIRGNAGRLHRNGALLRRCRRSGRRAEPGVRRAGGSLRISARQGCGAQNLLHRLHSGRQASCRARGQGHEAHHHGARRSFAGGGVCRCGSGKDRRHHRRVQISQRRPGLHLADALLRSGRRLSALSQALHRIRQRHQAR